VPYVTRVVYTRAGPAQGFRGGARVIADSRPISTACGSATRPP